MKILKYTFIEEKVIKNGEDIVIEDEEQTLSFCCLLSSLGLFEEEYGKSLVDMVYQSLVDTEAAKELDNIDFIKAVSSCMYLKMTDNEIINNEISKDEFKSMSVYGHIASNPEFKMELLKCLVDNITERKKKSLERNNNESKKSKK